MPSPLSTSTCTPRLRVGSSRSGNLDPGSPRASTRINTSTSGGPAPLGVLSAVVSRWRLVAGAKSGSSGSSPGEEEGGSMGATPFSHNGVGSGAFSKGSSVVTYDDGDSTGGWRGTCGGGSPDWTSSEKNSPFESGDSESGGSGA